MGNSNESSRPRFDASSEPDAAGDRASEGTSPRPFLGIRFECCRTYGRIYRNDEMTAYVGNCPKCRARISVPIGNDGTSSRFFSAR